MLCTSVLIRDFAMFYLGPESRKKSSLPPTASSLRIAFLAIQNFKNKSVHVVPPCLHKNPPPAHSLAAVIFWTLPSRNRVAFSYDFS